MWPFSGKQKIVKKIQAAAWGNLVKQGIDVDTLTKDVRCVEKKGEMNHGTPVTYMRVFKLSEAANKGVEIAGWETFDLQPELILFEGYVNLVVNETVLEKKRP